MATPLDWGNLTVASPVSWSSGVGVPGLDWGGGVRTPPRRPHLVPSWQPLPTSAHFFRPLSGFLQPLRLPPGV